MYPILHTPAHPGQFLAEEIIQPLGLTIGNAAKHLGVTRQMLSSLLNGRASLSPQMALRFEKAFGVSMATLLRMQTNYDIAATRRDYTDLIVMPYHPA